MTSPEIDTVPHNSSENDTGNHQQDSAIAKAYLAAESLVMHLRGVVDGVQVDIAQSQSFEARAAQAISSIDAKQDRILGLLDNLANGLLETAQKVILLEDWRRKRERTTCEDCPNRVQVRA
jgi:ABC-type transporter Mla subunit MlaD